MFRPGTKQNLKLKPRRNGSPQEMGPVSIALWGTWMLKRSVQQAIFRPVLRPFLFPTIRYSYTVHAIGCISRVTRAIDLAQLLRGGWEGVRTSSSAYGKLNSRTEQNHVYRIVCLSCVSDIHVALVARIYSTYCFHITLRSHSDDRDFY